MTGRDDGGTTPVAIVTGASSGLGRACALRLARDGFRVALLAGHAGQLSELEREVERGGGIALSRPVDLAEAQKAMAAVDGVVGAWGRVDVLVFPHMRRAGGGTIVNVSSVAGLRGWANAAAYCSSKFALTGFTQSLAAEGRPHGIRACVLYTGAMATSWGVWDPEERQTGDGKQRSSSDGEAIPADQVADLVSWIVAAPSGLVLDQVTVTPLHERGWP